MFDEKEKRLPFVPVKASCRGETAPLPWTPASLQSQTAPLCLCKVNPLRFPGQVWYQHIDYHTILISLSMKYLWVLYCWWDKTKAFEDVTLYSKIVMGID